MKAKRRVVTASGGISSAKRRPTVRKPKSAIVSPPRRAVVEPLPETGAPLGGEAEAGLDPALAAVDLSIDLGRGLRLANPLIAASGPFGYGVEVRELVAVDRIGAICTRSTTLKPRSGNPPPRMVETAAGLLHSTGLQNPGIDAVLERYAPVWAAWRVPVIVNVAGATPNEYVEVVRRLDGVPGVAGVELNLSCPNAAAGGTWFGLDARAAATVTGAVRRAIDLPLLVKLAPELVDIRTIARAVGEAGADALVAVNAVPALVPLPGGGPLVGGLRGGLSGPAIRPIALRMVHEVAGATDLPIVGVGGVADLADVLDFLAVGAVAVQVGAATLADPALPVRLADALAAECLAHGSASTASLVGTALPTRRRGRPRRGAQGWT